ncbi:hypothetical protein [Bradyrhizobium jicamae]|uniref:hypothetical protein n=1 Tax=Bradyrhizobium jicamae TaxID=280332 RepID=UPI0012ECBB7D|nr:hypothetical protein [Bradyrhizobium jicamae]
MSNGERPEIFYLQLQLGVERLHSQRADIELRLCWRELFLARHSADNIRRNSKAETFIARSAESSVNRFIDRSTVARTLRASLMASSHTTDDTERATI